MFSLTSFARDEVPEGVEACWVCRKSNSGLEVASIKGEGKEAVAPEGAMQGFGDLDCAFPLVVSRGKKIQI